MSSNPKNVKAGDLIRIPGGRGHRRGFFHVRAVEDFPANSNKPTIMRRGWYWKDRDFTEVRCVRVAWDDGRPSRGKKVMGFLATEVECIDRQIIIKECDEAIRVAQEKRDCIIEFIDELEKVDT